MCADDLARGISEDAGPRGIGRVALDKRRVIAVGDEADLVAVGLVGDRQSALARDRAHVRLRQLADWKLRARELLLREREEKVGLILVAVDAAQQLVAPRI